MQNRYSTLGNGPEKILVTHDFFASTASYEPIHNYLNQEQFTYVFFDLRGYGRSKTIEGNYTIGEVTEDCLELVKHLGWEQFHVVGHSMTGQTIQHFALAAPDRVKSATAITPVPAAGSPIPEDFLQVIRAGVNGDDGIMREIIDGASGNRYHETFLNYKLKQFRACATPDARLGYLKMFTETDISEGVKGLEVPFHVIIGACDSEWHGKQVMDETFGKFYPNYTLTEIADASHYPMQETPILLASHIEKYISRVSTSQKPIAAAGV